MPGLGKNLCDPRLLLGMLMMETNERLLSERGNRPKEGRCTRQP